MDVAGTLQAYERIGVIGLGVTGLSAARFLRSHELQPILFDTRTDAASKLRDDDELNQCEQHFGPLKIEDMLGLDLVIMSPGLAFDDPALLMAFDAGVEFISEIELFARLVEVPILAVTGSNGKSTVVTLAAQMLAHCGRNVGLGGNIGTPALDLLDHDYDCMVLELSSFQLEQTYTLEPAAACVLNVTPDHLDRYSDFDAYSRTKNRIYRKAEVLVFNRDDHRTLPLRTRALQHVVSIGLGYDEQNFALSQIDGEEFITFSGQPLLPVAAIPMPGDYNKVNVMAALALVAALGTDLEQAAAAVADFKALPHRSQLIKDANQVRWVNDSKATNIGATIAAIEGLRSDVTGKLILIAGGDAKGTDMSPLKDVLEDVDLLITLGRDGAQIATLKTGALQVESMSQAVEEAARHTSAGSMVLLSPACASLDMFTDYQQRGNVFVAAVEALHGRS